MNDISDMPVNSDIENQTMTVADFAPQDDAPIKRGRGRPRKDAGASGGTMSNPVALGPTGARKAPGNAKNTEHIQKILFSIHEKAALGFGNPMIAIDKEEAILLADAIAGVMDYYKIKIDGKRGAFVALAYAVSVVYGPRAFAEIMKYRMKQSMRENTETE